VDEAISHVGTASPVVLSVNGWNEIENNYVFPPQGDKKNDIFVVPIQPVGAPVDEARSSTITSFHCADKPELGKLGPK
jgi:hypothetical protein